MADSSRTAQTGLWDWQPDEPSPAAKQGRLKPRMSTAERRQAKKKAEALSKGERAFATAKSVDPTSESTATATLVNETAVPSAGVEDSKGPVARLRREIDAQVSRQLSDSSNFIAKRCLEARDDEDASKVQRALLAISRAHRNGLISVRDKASLKDLLLDLGSQTVLQRISAIPGGSRILSTSQSPAAAEASVAKIGSSSRLHVFRNLVEGYSVTMPVSEALRMELALVNGSGHCAVSSSFVCLQPRKIESQLHVGTRQVLGEPNAGGRSYNSEALSFETLHALFGASHLVTEMSVRYVRRHTPIVDYICVMFGHRVGVSVSVTRGMHYLGEHQFQYNEARSLIERKLSGLDRAGDSVVDELRFDRQVLHIWAQSDRVAELCLEVFQEVRGQKAASMRRRGDSSESDEDQEEEEELSGAYLRPTVCLVTVCDRLERFVFSNEGDLDFEKGERDPQGFEAMKRKLKRADDARVSHMILEGIKRKQEHQSAIRRVFTSDRIQANPSKHSS